MGEAARQTEDARREFVSAFPKIHITVLGSGTSSGVPTIGCTCEVCRSTDPRDKRLRPSILMRYGGHNVVVDTSPDFRAQVLRAKLDRLDAILYTHAHADHILGLDDIRPFNYRQKSPTPLYGTPETLEAIQRVFRYAFDGGADAILGSQARSAAAGRRRRSICSDWSSRPSACAMARARCLGFASAARRTLPITARFRRNRAASWAGWMYCFWTPCGIGRIRPIRP